MTVLFIGKRFYTNRDALSERFGRIWNLPWHWSRQGVSTRLWLVDYHTRKADKASVQGLEVWSTPVWRLDFLSAWRGLLAAGGRNVDVVVASGDCYVGLLGSQVARSLGARFVFDVYDKYDEFGAYMRVPGFDPFDYLLRRSDAVLFASQAMMDRCEAATAPKYLVPNGVDYGHFQPLDTARNRERFSVSSDFMNIGYFGSFTPDRGVADLLAAVAGIRARGVLMDVVLAGREEGFSVPRHSWIHYLGNLAYKDVPAAMACCELLALPYRHSEYLDMASSCKVAEYIAVQKPIVATDTPNFRVNFPEQFDELSDLVASPGNPKDLERAIMRQSVERRLVKRSERFSWESIAADLSRKLFPELGGIN